MLRAATSGQMPHLAVMLPLLLLTVAIAGAIPAKIFSISDEPGLGTFGGSSLERQNFRDGRYLQPHRMAEGYVNEIRAIEKPQVDDNELNTIHESDSEEFENEKDTIRAKSFLTKTEYNKLMKKFNYGKIPKKGITYQYKPSSYLDLPRSFIRFDEILATKDTDKFILEEDLSTVSRLPTEVPLMSSTEHTLRDLVIHLMEPDMFLKVPSTAWGSGKTSRSSIKFSEVEILDKKRNPEKARVLSLSVLDPVLSQIEVLGNQSGPFTFNSPLSPDTRISLDQMPINRLLQEASNPHPWQTELPENEEEITEDNSEALGDKLENESSEGMSVLSSMLDSPRNRNISPLVTKESAVSFTHQDKNYNHEKSIETDLGESDEEKVVLSSVSTDPYVYHVEHDHDTLNSSRDNDSIGVELQAQPTHPLTVSPAPSRPRRALNLFRFSGESGKQFNGFSSGPLPPSSNYTPTYGIRNATIDPERKRQRFNQLILNMDFSPDSLLTPFLVPAARSLDSMASLMDYTMPTLPPLIAPSDLPMLFAIPPVEEWFPAINGSASPFNWTLPKPEKLTSLPGLNLTSLSKLNLTSLPGLNLSSLSGLNLSSLPGLDLSSLPGLNLSSLPGLNLSSLPSLNLVSLPGLDLSSLQAPNLTPLPGLDLTSLRNSDNETVPGAPNIKYKLSSAPSGQLNNSGLLDTIADLRNKFSSFDSPLNPNISADNTLNLPFMDAVVANNTDFLKTMALKYQTMTNISSDSQMPSAIADLASIISTSLLPSTAASPGTSPPQLPTTLSGLRNVFDPNEESLSNLFNINPSVMKSMPQNVNISSLFSLTDAFSSPNSPNNQTMTPTNAFSSFVTGMNPAIKNKLQNFFNSSTTEEQPTFFSLISRAVENATTLPANISDVFNIFTQAAETTTTNPLNSSNIFGQNNVTASTALSDILDIFTQTSEITTANPFNLSSIFLQSTEEKSSVPNLFGTISQPTGSPNPWNLTNVFTVVQETTTSNPWNVFAQSTETVSQNPWDITKLFPAKGQVDVTISRNIANPFLFSTEASTPTPWNFNTAFPQSTEATTQNPWSLINAFTQSVGTTAPTNPFNIFTAASIPSPTNAFNVFSSPAEVSTRSSLDLFNAFFRPAETVTQNPWNLFNAFQQTTETTTPNPWSFLNLFGASATATTPGQPLPSNFGALSVASNQDMTNNIDGVTEFFRRSGIAMNKGNSETKKTISNPLFIPRSYLPPPNTAGSSQDGIIPSASSVSNPFVTNIRQISYPVEVFPRSTINESDSDLISIMSSVVGSPSNLPGVPNYLQGFSMDTILAMVPNLNLNLVSAFMPLVKKYQNITTSTEVPILSPTGLRVNSENLTSNDNEADNSTSDRPNSIDTFKQNFLNFFALNKSVTEDGTVATTFVTPPPLFPNLGNNRRNDMSSWTPLLGNNDNEDDSAFKHYANDPLTIEPAKPVLVFSVNDDDAPRTSKAALTVNFNKVIRNEPGKLTPAGDLSLPQYRNSLGRSLGGTDNAGTNLFTSLQGQLPNIPQEMMENMMASSGVSNNLLENVFRAMRSADFSEISPNAYTSNNSALPTLPPFVFPTFPPIKVTPTTTATPQSLFRYDPTATTPAPFNLFPPLALPTLATPATQNESGDDDFTRFLQEQAAKMSEFFEQMSDFSVEAVTHLKDAGTVVDSLGSAASRTIHALVDIAQVLEPVTNLITRKIQMVETDKNKSQQQQQQRDTPSYVRSVFQ